MMMSDFIFNGDKDIQTFSFKDITVGDKCIKNQNIDWIGNYILDDYGLESMDCKSAELLFANKEFSDIYSGCIESFLSHNMVFVFSGQDNDAGAFYLIDFHIDDIRKYVSDVFNAMDGLSVDYAQIFGLLRTEGYDYNNTEYNMPHLLHIADTCFTDDDDVNDVFFEGLEEYIRRRFKDSDTDAVIVTWYIPEDEDAVPDIEAREIFLDNGFMQIPKTTMLMRLYVPD